MFKINRFFFSILFICFVLFSCVRHKNIVLLNDRINSELDTILVNLPETYKVQENDVLNISVASSDQSSVAIFVKNVGSNSVQVTESMLYLNGYVVDGSGTINLPIIGDIYVKDKSVSEISVLLQNKMNSYFKFSVVDVKLVSFRVSFIGEVNNIGAITVYRNQLNLLEALSLTGGFTDFANMRDVKIVRTEKGKTKIKKVDFTKPNIVNHEWYYLKPNDVIYVEPLKVKPIKTNSTTISLVFSGLSFLILVINLTATAKK